ncbi:hypothetical protein O988_07759 [Pseudogymnoascus sp. VKM F-3808]|nr:hypothetical protein O988_07759 [Pseudogymnoascus sp. VKM F-3808]
MNIEDAESKLQSKREAYWAHLSSPNSKKLKRRRQNRINKRVSRWKSSYELRTPEDYGILGDEIQDMPEGVPKRRDGKPRRPEDKKRRTSQRLRNRRQKPDAEKLEEHSFFDSALASGFDQLDNAPHSEEDINISYSSVTSSGDKPPPRLPIEINRTPGSISSDHFDLYNPPNLSLYDPPILDQYSNIPSLADETWCHSNDPNDPASILRTPHSGTNIIGGRWMWSPQRDIRDRNSMGLDWQGDLPSFIDPSGMGQNWSGSDTFAPVPHVPFDQPVMRESMKPSSGRSGGGIQMQSPVTSPDEGNNRMHQPKRPDEAQSLMADLNPRLHEQRRGNIQKRPVLGRQPHEERDDLARLVEQCLLTLKKPTAHMSGNKEGGMEPKGGRPAEIYRPEVKRRVEFLWESLTSRVPSSATQPSRF